MDSDDNRTMFQAKHSTLEQEFIRPGSMPLLTGAETAPPQNCHRLVILGSARVGKTSLVNRFLNNKFEEKYTPTIEDFHRKIYRIKGESYRLDILDTSGNHPFPAMRRLSLLTGDSFILVYSIDNRESFDEVKRLHEQVLATKGQPTPGGTRPKRKNQTPIVIVANKCDKECDRVIDSSEMRSLIDENPSCGCVETSARKNINVEEIFVKLFVLAKLPTEMSPSLHRKVAPSHVAGSPRLSRRGMTLRRRLSDACGAVAPNVRRPSIRTDLLILQTKQSLGDPDVDGRGKEVKCSIQ